jgi:hypothetical protein
MPNVTAGINVNFQVVPKLTNQNFTAEILFEEFVESSPHKPFTILIRIVSENAHSPKDTNPAAEILGEDQAAPVPVV